jgi:hypothetical protein
MSCATEAWTAAAIKLVQLIPRSKSNEPDEIFIVVFVDVGQCVRGGSADGR